MSDCNHIRPICEVSDCNLAPAEKVRSRTQVCVCVYSACVCVRCPINNSKMRNYWFSINTLRQQTTHKKYRERKREKREKWEKPRVGSTLNLGRPAGTSMSYVSVRRLLAWHNSLRQQQRRQQQQPVAFVAISVRACNLLIHILHSIALG